MALRKYDVMITSVTRCTVIIDDEDPTVLSKSSMGYYPEMVEAAAREGRQCTWATVEHRYNPHTDCMAIEQEKFDGT